MGDSAHAMVPFYGQGMNAVSLTTSRYILAYAFKNTLFTGHGRLLRLKRTHGPIWRRKSGQGAPSFHGIS